MLLVNLSQDKSSINNYISNTLLNELEKNLENNKKSIIYLNKRGSFATLICSNCQKIYKCDNCDINMSVHNFPESLVCHLCSNTKGVPENCEDCGLNELVKVGVGTEQIESTLKNYFKESEIFRFDSDSVKNKTQKSEVLKKIESADIIVGTKMITTGFNIKNLGLIGVILLEQELQIPKYNTEENVYQNIKQLIGRGNRVGEKTEILIQTYVPENETIKLITGGNYKEFLNKSLTERKAFGYPPFLEYATVEYRDLDKEKAYIFITKIYDKLIKGNESNNIEIIKIDKSFKKNSSYYFKIIVKGENLRIFLKIIKNDILRNSKLNLIFE